MRTAAWKSAFVIVLVVFLTTLCSAAQKYDKSTEVTLKGTIEEIKTIDGPGEGIHLMLRVGDKLMLVHVAPEKFLKDMGIKLEKGEKIEVTGAKISGPDGDEVLARVIALNQNDSLTLRDDAGAPAWLGWK